MWGLPRKVQTTIPCKICATPLRAERSCREVTLVCPQCGAKADIKEYADSMDDALEEFMDALPCDRF